MQYLLLFVACLYASEISKARQMLRDKGNVVLASVDPLAVKDTQGSRRARKSKLLRRNSEPNASSHVAPQAVGVIAQGADQSRRNSAPAQLTAPPGLEAFAYHSDGSQEFRLIETPLVLESATLALPMRRKSEPTTLALPPGLF